MSAQFPLRGSDPNAAIPLAPNPTLDDPFGNVPGKIGDLLRSDSPLNSGLRNATASKHLLEHTDQLEDGPINFVEPPKTQEFDLGKEKGTGISAKVKDPRLKNKDKDKTQADGADGDSKAEGKDKKDKKDKDPLEAKPYDHDEFYKKNPNQLHFGGVSDFLNQKAYETSLRKAQQEAAEKAAKEGKQGDASPWGLTPQGPQPRADGGWKDRVATPQYKQTGLTSDNLAYGNNTPKLSENPWLETKEITRDASNLGYRQTTELNGGKGYSQVTAGTWGLNERVSKGGELQDADKGSTFSGGAGVRTDLATVVDAGPGQAMFQLNTLAGAEGSAGMKFKAGPLATQVAVGAEGRVGMYSEGAVTYRPVNFEPKIFGAPINLSPEISTGGRVSPVGAEAGASAKIGYSFIPDPTTGKLTPQIGADLKASAFAGGMAEGDVGVGIGGIGKVGVTYGALYGIGAFGKAKLGLEKDGGKSKLRFDFKFGAALGVGTSFGFKGEINVDGLMRFGANLVKANKAVFRSISRGFNNGLAAAREAASKALDGVKNAAHTVANKVKETANKVADKVKETAQKAADAVKETAEKAVDAVKDVGNKIADGAKKVFKKLKFW